MTSTKAALPGGGYGPAPDHRAQLEQRIADLERERDLLVAVVDILQEIAAASHFTEILQVIARKLGDTFGLERCSIYLAGAMGDASRCHLR